MANIMRRAYEAGLFSARYPSPVPTFSQMSTCKFVLEEYQIDGEIHNVCPGTDP